MTTICFQNSRSLSGRRVQPRGTEYARGRGNPCPNASFEVAPDALLYLGRAPIGLESLQVEPHALHPLPEVRVIHPPTVGIERVDHLEEVVLPARRLRGGMKGRRARMLAGDREVAKDQPASALLQMRPSSSAVRAAEVGVDDDPLLPLASDVIVPTDRWDRGTAETGHGA